MPRATRKEAVRRYFRELRREPLYKIEFVEVATETFLKLVRQAHRRGYSVSTYAGIILDRVLKNPVRKQAAQQELFDEQED